MLRYFLFLLISSSALSCEAITSTKDTLQGKVAGIADGATFTLLPDNKTTINAGITGKALGQFFQKCATDLQF